MAPAFADSAPDHTTAIAASSFFFYLRTLPTSTELNRVRHEIDLAGKKGILGYIQIMHPRQLRPLDITDEERRAWVALAESAKQSGDVGAIVIMQDGFSGAALRAAVSTVLLLSRGQKPIRVFDTVEPAMRWMAHLLRGKQGAPGEAELLAAAHAVMARLQ